MNIKILNKAKFQFLYFTNRTQFAYQLKPYLIFNLYFLSLIFDF